MFLGFDSIFINSYFFTLKLPVLSSKAIKSLGNKVLKLLQKLARETNKTILFSSHEIDLAIQLCDNLIVMTDTEVVSDEPCNLISKGTFKMYAL